MMRLLTSLSRYGVKPSDGEIGTVHEFLFEGQASTIKYVVAKTGSWLRRGSTVVLQRSLKDGCGLTVSETPWNPKPTIASAVGRIPLQITRRYSGILSHAIQGTAHAIKQLINDPEYARRLRVNGREYLKNNFLITREIKDYRPLFVSLSYTGDIAYLS